MLERSKVLICALFIVWIDTPQRTERRDASDNLHFIAHTAPFQLKKENAHQSPRDHSWNLNTKKLSATTALKEPTSKEAGRWK